MTGYAKAPSFGDLPDVIISDQEKNEATGFTTDYNFFVYMNAFDMLAYAADEDSTPTTDLKFMFVEDDAPDYDDLAINDVLQLDQGAYDPSDPSTWPVGSLIIPAGQGSGGDFTVSFRDLVRSPGTSEGPFPDPIYSTARPTLVSSGDTGIFLPWHDTSGNLVRTPDTDKPARMVTIWAGDEDDNAGSGSLMVYSVNEVKDDLSIAMTTIFSDDMVGDNIDGWIVDPETFGITPATPGSVGALTLQVPAFTGANYTYSRWRLRTYDEMVVKPTIPGVPTPYGQWVPIEYVPDDSIIYSGRFTIAHNQASRGTVPTMRLGIADALAFQTALTFVGTIAGAPTETANSQWPAQNTPKVYRQYWANNPGADESTLDLGDGTGIPGGVGGDMRNFNAFFDILNKNAGGVGTLTLSDFEVVTMPRPAASSPVAHTVAADYVPDDITPANPEVLKATAVANVPADTLTFTVPASTTGGTVPWVLRTNYDAVQLALDSLVRVRVELSCPLTADRDNFKQFRVRFNTPFANQDGLYYVEQYDPGFSSAVVGYPSLPPSQEASPGATAIYDVYMPVYLDDLTDLQAFGDPDGTGSYTASDVFATGLDYIGNPRANTTASTVTVHSVTHEVLSLPAL
jgi:hypothetical protein